MAFVSRLTAEVAVAGGVNETPVADQKQYSRAPIRFDLRNLYFRDKLPAFEKALKIDGNCAGHGGVNDGDIALYSTKVLPNAIGVGDVIVLKASENYPNIEFDKNWKCLRVFEGMSDAGKLKVSSLSGDNQKKVNEVDQSAFIGKAVYAFSV